MRRICSDTPYHMGGENSTESTHGKRVNHGKKRIGARDARLRAANFKFERRLHDIQAAAFEAQSKAREDYLAEVAEINGGADAEEG